MAHPKPAATSALSVVTSCLEDQANACGIVPDVGIYWSADPLPIGIDQDGCYMWWLHTGQRLVLVILEAEPMSDN